MSVRNPIWRSILWVERFLPTMARPAVEEPSAARRRAAFLPLVVIPFVLLPQLLRNRHELGAMLRQNLPIIEQLMLGLAVVAALAVVIAGVVTWRRETGR